MILFLLQPQDLLVQITLVQSLGILGLNLDQTLIFFLLLFFFGGGFNPGQVAYRSRTLLTVSTCKQYESVRSCVAKDIKVGTRWLVLRVATEGGKVCDQSKVKYGAAASWWLLLIHFRGWVPPSPSSDQLDEIMQRSREIWVSPKRGGNYETKPWKKTYLL